MEQLYNKALRNAVDHLYREGIIKKDYQIAEKTGYGKSAVSAYINGRQNASADFLEAFSKAYKINLADFEQGEDEIVQFSPSEWEIMKQLAKTHAYLNVLTALVAEGVAQVKGSSVTGLQAEIRKTVEAELKAAVDKLGKRV